MRFKLLPYVAVAAFIGSTSEAGAQAIVHTRGVSAVQISETSENTPIAYRSHLKPVGFDWEAKFEIDGPWRMRVFEVTIQPGGFVGWHTHPNLTFLNITQGRLTFYWEADSTCSPEYIPAGKTYIEGGTSGKNAMRQFGKNEGTVPLKIIVVSILPQGAPFRVDSEAPPPAHCPDLTQ